MGTTLCTSKKQGTILNFLLSLAWRITKCEILLISLLTYHPSGRQLWKEKQVLLWSLRMKSFRGSWNGMIFRMPMKPNATVQSECPILLRAIVLNVSESSKLFKITEFFFSWLLTGAASRQEDSYQTTSQSSIDFTAQSSLSSFEFDFVAAHESTSDEDDGDGDSAAGRTVAPTNKDNDDDLAVKKIGKYACQRRCTWNPFNRQLVEALEFLEHARNLRGWEPVSPSSHWMWSLKLSAIRRGY